VTITGAIHQESLLQYLTVWRSRDALDWRLSSKPQLGTTNGALFASVEVEVEVEVEAEVEVEVKVTHAEGLVANS
jgi:hypothetical protein